MNLSSIIDSLETELRRRRQEGENEIVLGRSTLHALFGGRQGTRELASPPDHQSKASLAGESHPSESHPSPNTLQPLPTPPETGPSSSPSHSTFPEPPSDLQPPPGLDTPSRWAWLRERVLSCPVCQQNLNPGGKIVFGTGKLDSEILFCGEAPGAEEEKTGIPFVGPAGELLTKMIQAMNLSRDEVYITNIVNWRPQTGQKYGNRPPLPEEIAFCLPYFREQLKLVQPKIIVALGATAASALSGTPGKIKMGAVRGTWSTFEGFPITFTYHPSFLLHNGTIQRKREVWEDLLEVMLRLGMPISEKQKGYFTGG
ncbi:MAG: uracil-DNA glycosylase family protein [Puniceicoccaceae bacterium]